MVLTRSMENLNLITMHSNSNVVENDNQMANSNNQPVLDNNINPNISNQSRSSHIKLPQFWIDNPNAWFIQADTIFNIHNITNDDIKYQNTIIALTQEVITKVIDVIQSPPLINKYILLKKTLCERFSMSIESRLELLLTKSSLGDSKPSDLFREMQNCVSADALFSVDLLYKLWIRKLPAQLQLSLTGCNTLLNINEKVDLADKLFEIYEKPSISTISNNNTLESSVNNLTQLTNSLSENINQLSMEVSELKINKYNKKNYQNKSNYRNASTICWYHSKFGTNAKKCIKPCNFKPISLN